MAVPVPGSDGDIAQFVLPEIESVERNVSKLHDQTTTTFDRQHAAYEIIKSFNTTANVGLKWAPEFPPTREPLLRAQSEGYLINLGESLNAGLLRQHVLWPPPVRRPPSAVTRDLLELYRAAMSNPMNRIVPPSAEPFEVIRRKTAMMLTELDSARRAVDIAALRAITEQSPRNHKSRLGTMLSGLGLVIGLMQGPSVIHNFASDTVELGDDIHNVIDFAIDGLNNLAAEVVRSMEDGWLVP